MGQLDKRFFFIIFTILLIICGQNCTNSYLVKILDPQLEQTQFSGGGGGNGTGYDGKLTYLALVPGFTCEGDFAPVSILRRDENRHWTITNNHRDKCAIQDMQEVLDVPPSEGAQIINYHEMIYTLDLKAPWQPSSLRNYIVNYKVNLFAKIDSRDANPGDGNCADSEGLCSLTAAIDEVNNQIGVAKIINLPSGIYKLTNSITIDSPTLIMLAGEDKNNTILDGNGTLEILASHMSSINAALAAVQITNLTFTKGVANSPFGAAAINVMGSVYIDNCSFNQNLGGGSVIYAGVTGKDLYLRNSIIDSNQTSGVSLFGARSTVIENTQITNNTAYAVDVNNGTSNVKLLALKISFNLTGIHFHKCEDNCLITDSEITNNSTYGLEIASSSSNVGNNIVIANSTLANNGTLALGSNIFIGRTPAPSRNLMVEQSMISNNFALTGVPNCTTASTASNPEVIIINSNSNFDDLNCR